jgi:hypothetical protein
MPLDTVWQVGNGGDLILLRRRQVHFLGHQSVGPIYM